MATNTLSIEQRADFDFLRYGSVWEDADLLCRALAPRAKGGRILSIAAAGDNSLALLSLDPKEVVAVDLNPAQLACLDLKRAAFQALDHGALLEFLGVEPSTRRLATYASLRKRLSTASAKLWDAHAEAIELGVIHSGKLERFLRRYKNWLHRWVHNAENVDALLQTRPVPARAAYYRRHWNTWAWRLLNRIAFSERVLGTQGRDPQFFLHAAEDVTSGPSQRLERLLQSQALGGNPYLRYQLTGNYAHPALPLYLRPRHFKVIRRNSDRLRLLLGAAGRAPGRFDAFNLSNIFEYMSAEQHVEVYAGLIKKARPGARLAYWNLHVERACPPELSKKVRPLEKLSASLHAKDQYWAYRSFHVDQVVAKNQ